MMKTRFVLWGGWFGFEDGCLAVNPLMSNSSQFWLAFLHVNTILVTGPTMEKDAEI